MVFPRCSAFLISIQVLTAVEKICQLKGTNQVLGLIKYSVAVTGSPSRAAGKKLNY